MEAELIIQQHTTNPDLAELLIGCEKGDRLAQARLYQMFHGKLMSVCLRYFSNRDDALEALNHGFYKIFRNLSQFQSEKEFEAWSYRIVQNTAIDYVRKKYRIEYELIEEGAEPEVTCDPEVIQKLNADSLLVYFQQLPPATRTVFNLFAIEGYSHDEISKMLNISVGTSKWHVNQARERLQKLI